MKMTNIKKVLKFVFLSKRINRLRYINSVYCTLMVSGLFIIIFALENNMLTIGATVLAWLLILWFSKSRLNDSENSGVKLSLLIAGGLLIIILPNVFMPDSDATPYLYIIGSLFLIPTLIVAVVKILFYKGTPGVNKYGAPSPANTWVTVLFTIVFLTTLACSFLSQKLHYNIWENQYTAITNCVEQTDADYKKLLENDVWVNEQYTADYYILTAFNKDGTFTHTINSKNLNSKPVITITGSWKIENGKMITSNIDINKLSNIFSDSFIQSASIDHLECADEHYFRAEALNGSTLRFFKVSPEKI